MALSDCEKCWNTPCDCGWEYRNWTQKKRIQFAAVVIGIAPEAMAGLGVPLVHPQIEAAPRAGTKT